jgi:CHAD domain-containing protein
MTGGAIETEIKLGAWPGFTLPDLTDVAPGVTVEELPTLDLDAVYVDTADLRLVRRGVSLRRRTGEGAPRWTLKLPDAGDGGAALRRREIDVESPRLDVPEQLADLLTAWVRNEPLVAVTTIRTRRRRLALRGADGADLGELDDDEVSVIDDGHVAARFRELEVELSGVGSPDLLTLVAAALERAGAGAPDRTTKVVRALGPRALAPPDLVVAEVDEHASTADLVVAGFGRAVRSILDHDHVIRLDDDTEGVHKARVGTRRLRSDLQTFAPVLDEGWAGALRADLRDLAAALGGVRDADVLLERLWHAVQDLDADDRAVGATLLDHLHEERRQHLADLLVAMRAPGYTTLLDRLVDAATHPRLTKAARQPAVDVVPSLVAPRWNRLVKAVRRLGDQPTDDELHRVRILAKRARYAADVAAPVIGEPAVGLSRSLAALQDVLGELHDTAVARQWLRRAAGATTHAQAFAAGELAERQRQRAAELRAQWPEAWVECHRKAHTRWLR